MCTCANAARWPCGTCSAALSAARSARGQGLYADRDAVALRRRKAWLLGRDTDIDRLVEELIEAEWKIERSGAWAMFR